ncbi:acyltransferase family protein [Silvibacterium acidisoli]|uniref:acyltransferase family protein n=1 Tax=Acidobacteriaceae bacterium ZG23-2 TaxID=2883246 RepID=UPI00406CE642
MATSISKRHVPSLDGVRGLAALAVFTFHYGGGARSSHLLVQSMGHAIRFGAAGVPLFFVLSGFLITGILWDGYGRHGWWRNFFARRSLRIFPLYYAVMCLAVVASILLGDSWAQTKSLWPYFLYLQSVPFDWFVMGPAPTHLKFYHLWSLAVEEQFYLLWPFMLWPFRNRIRSAQWLCIVIWASSLVFRVWTGHTGVPQWGYDVPANAGELSMGSWLALAMRESEQKRERILRFAPAVLGVALAGACVDAWLGRAHVEGGLYPFPSTAAGLSIYAILFTSLIALCLRPGLVSKIFSFAPLRGAGKISYGIYIFHVALMPFYYWLLSPLADRIGHNAFLGVRFCVALFLTLCIATLSFYLFESKVGSLKRYFPSAASVPPAVADVVPPPLSATQTMAS